MGTLRVFDKKQKVSTRPLDFSLTVVFTGIARSIDPRDTLSLLHSAEDQDCLQGPHQRSPVLFGLDSVSGCTLRQDILALNRSSYSVQVSSWLNTDVTCLFPADWRTLPTALWSFKCFWMF